jgi:glycosyltransferase involved in cell wall biosynthesis
MNLLFIHETEYIEKMIFEYQIIPEILATQGHRVIVIDFPHYQLNNKKNSPLSQRTETLENISRAKKAGTVTLIRPAFLRISLLDRFTAFFSYFGLIDSVIKKYNIDVVVLLAAPTNGIQALWATRKHKVPVHFRLLDVLHRLVPIPSLRWLAYLIERLIYPRVDQLSAITPRLRDYAVAMGANPQTSSYLPSGADTDLFFYQEKDPGLMNKYNISPADQVLLFAGTIYHFSGLDRVIANLPNALKKNPKLKLLIVGAGEQESQLKSLVQELGLERAVIFTGFISYPELPRYVNLADICINPFEINKITNIIFPGKIYQYLACEKPVIATKLQGMLDVFPIDDPNSGIHYFDTVEEFFVLVDSIGRCRVKDPNPSLQEITAALEEELKKLCARKKGETA